VRPPDSMQCQTGASRFELNPSAVIPMKDHIGPGFRLLRHLEVPPEMKPKDRQFAVQLISHVRPALAGCVTVI